MTGSRRGDNSREKGVETRNDIMAYLIEYIGTHGYAPTREEIAAEIDKTTETVRKRLQDLEKEGLIALGPGSRAIAVKV